MTRLVSLILLLLLTSCGTPSVTLPPPMTDAEASRKILGTWVPATGPTGAKATYFSDGTSVESIPDGPNGLPLLVKSRWTITNGVLVITCTWTSAPSIPIGTTIKDRIISLTADRFEYREEGGYGLALGQKRVRVRGHP